MQTWKATHKLTVTPKGERPTTRLVMVVPTEPDTSTPEVIEIGYTREEWEACDGGCCYRTDEGWWITATGNCTWTVEPLADERVTLTNSYHNTSVTVELTAADVAALDGDLNQFSVWGYLEQLDQQGERTGRHARQVARIRRELCGMADCRCGIVR